MILGDKDTDIPHDLIDSFTTTLPDQPCDSGNYPAVPDQVIPQVLPENSEQQYHLGQTLPMNRYQKITALRMLQSKRDIPCFYLTIQVDMTELIEFRSLLNADSNTDVTYNDLIIRAVAMSIEKFNIMTGQLDGDNIKLADSIGIGLAISLPGGLIAPVIKDANNKTVKQIAAETKLLIEKANSSKLTPEDIEGGCITISNLGSRGIESFIPIVIPGQCSILGIGKIVETPIPDRGSVLEKKIMKMTLSVDHRVANGSYAAQFLDLIRQLLQDPKRL